jgi:hypothetical protein
VDDLVKLLLRAGHDGPKEGKNIVFASSCFPTDLQGI